MQIQQTLFGETVFIWVLSFANSTGRAIILVSQKKIISFQFLAELCYIFIYIYYIYIKAKLKQF